MPPRNTYHIISGGGDSFNPNTISEVTGNTLFDRAKTLYVGNFSREVSEKELINTCKIYGKLVRVDYVWHTEGELKGLPKGFAFIEFDSESEAHKAKNALNDIEMYGRRLRVDFYSEELDKTSHEEKKIQVSNNFKLNEGHLKALLNSVNNDNDEIEIFGLKPISEFKKSIDNRYRCNGQNSKLEAGTSNSSTSSYLEMREKYKEKANTNRDNQDRYKDRYGDRDRDTRNRYRDEGQYHGRNERNNDRYYDSNRDTGRYRNNDRDSSYR